MHARPIIFEDHTFPLFSKWLQSHWGSSYQQRLPFNIHMMDGGHYRGSKPSHLAWTWDMKVWILSETHITGSGHPDSIVNMTVALDARSQYLHEVHLWKELSGTHASVLIQLWLSSGNDFHTYCLPSLPVHRGCQVFWVSSLESDRLQGTPILWNTWEGLWVEEHVVGGSGGFLDSVGPANPFKSALLIPLSLF